jgi:hypothetical protein
VAEKKNMTLIESARTMFDEYKTFDHFQPKEVNMICHTTNCLYLHPLLNKMPYELQTSNKPNASYFRVFGCKCHVLHKRPKSSKFAPKVYEGFLLGYDSNSRAYHLSNNDSSCVKTTCDAVCDETNDSQIEQYDLDVVHDEEDPCDALRRMVIGDVRPQEPNENHPSSNESTPPTQGNDQDQENEQDEGQDQDMGNDQGGVVQEEEGDIQEESRSSPPPHPRVRQTVQRDHPVDNTLGDIKKGVTTRSRAAIFCENYSFVSSFEPLKVEDALRDPDWVVAMQEKLNNFKRNEVWSLVERPKQNVVSTNWYSTTNKMNTEL